MSRGPDLISKSNLPPSVTPPQPSPPPPPPPSVTSALGPSGMGNGNSRLPVKKNNHSYINNGFNSSGNSMNSGVYRPGAGSLASGSAPMRRITMVGDDIILEEEELPATPSPTAKSAPFQLPSVTAKVMKSPIYMNVNSPKRMLPYSDKMPINDALQQQELLKQQQRTSPVAQGRDEVDPVPTTTFPNPKD